MAAGPASTAPSTPAMSQSGLPKPHDPMKTVDGMFKGCVMRMAYAFKDPKNFGESTKIIISECTKKYQDALDDCEIQILDAKWYLEQKLAENKARREEKAREASAATAKRKHDEAAEMDQSMNVESPPKRTKANDSPSPRSSSAAQNLSNTTDSPSEQAQQTNPLPQPAKPQQPTIKTEEKKPTTPQPPAPSQVQKPDPPPIRTKPDPDPDPAPAPTPIDEFSKQTPDATPAMMNDDFTFESMFTDALGDDDNDNKDDLDIGLDDDPFGDDFGSDPFANDTSMTTTQQQPTTQTQSQSQPPKPIPTQAQSATKQEQPTTTDTPDNAFSALLEGVEQFANQPDDSNSTQQRPGGPTNTNSNATTNAFTADMDMGTNIFDSFLNDEFDVGSNNGGDFGTYGDGDGGEVNFDDLFGDGS